MPRAKLARFPAPFSSVLPGLFVAGDDTREIHSLARGHSGRRGSATTSDASSVGSPQTGIRQ